MRWLGGIYSPQPLSSRWQRLLAMGAPDNPVRHRTVTVHCPVCATSARLLGFGAVDCWRRLSFCSTGQSGATPDSPVTSDFCCGTVPHCSILQSTIGAQEAVAPLPHRTVRWHTGQSIPAVIGDPRPPATAPASPSWREQRRSPSYKTPHASHRNRPSSIQRFKYVVFGSRPHTLPLGSACRCMRPLALGSAGQLASLPSH
jgi:hypothetical protein